MIIFIANKEVKEAEDMIINEINTNYSQSKSNVNFKSTIVNTKMAKEGFAYAKKLSNGCSIGHTFLLRDFTIGIKRILNDGKNHVVNVYEARTPNPFVLKHSISIDNKVVKDSTLFPGEKRIGFQFVNAIIDLTKRSRLSSDGTKISLYEKTIAEIEKEVPKEVKSKQVITYFETKNEELLDEITKVALGK